MVTGEKPGEQVDWGQLNAWAADVADVWSPFLEVMDRLALRLFGTVAAEIPAWYDELAVLEGADRLPLRLRKRRASLRARERRLVRLAARRLQRLDMGIEEWS